jgi:hypothetical protein
MTRLAGIVLIISVLCFGVGVTRPVVLDYFSTDNGVEKRQLVQENPEQWQFANTMMNTGIKIAPIGVLLFALAQLRGRKENTAVLLAVASAISVSLAAAIWNSRYWAFPRFTVLMTLGIVLLGYNIRQRHSEWGGTLTIAVEVVTVVLLYIVIQDVPPGVHFFPLLMAGTTLLVFGGAARVEDTLYMASDPPA